MTSTATGHVEARFYGAPQTSLASEVNGREHEFPLLARSLVGAKPALSPTIEWLTEDDAGGLRAERNECQILRATCKYGFGANLGVRYQYEQEALTEFLGDVEKILWDGVPHYDDSRGYPLRMCGGVRHFLGRDPIDGDKITLLILRDLIRRDDDDGGEWIAEFSLIARSAKGVVQSGA